MRSDGRTGDTGTVSAAVEVLEGRSARRGLARILPFLGPAFVASVAYIDPGNFATNIQGGAQFGYLLLWVIVASNLTAMMVQALSAKLGIATGRNLAEVCRDQFSRPVVWGMWVINELVAMATDLAEFLGAALGFYLLLRIPLMLAAFLTGIITLVILAPSRSFRKARRSWTGPTGSPWRGTPSSPRSPAPSRSCWPPESSAPPSCRPSSSCPRR